MKTVKGFKAYEPGLRCRGKQYKENEIFEEKDLSICGSGMHFCKMPLDVLNYYPNAFVNEYTPVEALGEIEEEGDKAATKKLKIGAKISFTELFKIHFNMIFEKVGLSKSVNQTSGNYSHSQTSGYESHSQTSGYESHSQTSGYKGHSQTSGYESHSQTSGNYSHSQTSGNYSHSQTSGYKSHSQTSGDESHSQTSGYESHSQTSGYKSHSQTSGNYSHSQTSGNHSHSQTSGDKSHSQTSGDESIACSLGVKAKAKAEKGWIIVVDWQFEKKWIIKKIYSKKVGQKIKGIKIEPTKWYWFENGELRYE